MHTWSEFGIETRGRDAGELKTVCPKCSASRKKQHYPCLSVNLDKGVWHCWHCEYSGSLHSGEDRLPHLPQMPRSYRKPVYRATPLPQRVLSWFASRGIPENVLARNRISYGPVYMPQIEEEVTAIQFPYFRDGEVVNVKYRDGHKHFRMVGGGERLLYGLDDAAPPTLIVVEGEMDKLAVEVAGFLSCVSVPDGAPSPNTKNYASKFDYLASAEAVLTPCTKIILAVDADAPGETLAQELARRLGPERCWRVEWSAGCKDANDVLMSYGPETLKECLDHATPWPVSGIIGVSQLVSAVLHMHANGVDRGLSPGWFTLERYYTVRAGEMTIVTGIPGDGKSTFLSALAVNLARDYAWRFAIFSPENTPLERYAAALVEQYTGRQFDGVAGPMPEAELVWALEWLDEHVSFLLPDDAVPTIPYLLELARIQVLRQGIRGLILDPWSEIEHSRPAGQTETEYVSHMLSLIRRFGRLHGVHVWVVAHPTKLLKPSNGVYAPPTPYDIAGSAHFYNKADNCLTVWRDREAGHGRVEIHIGKIRSREIGRTGMVELEYDRSCRRYADIGAAFIKDEAKEPAWNY